MADDINERLSRRFGGGRVAQFDDVEHIERYRGQHIDGDERSEITSAGHSPTPDFPSYLCGSVR